MSRFSIFFILAFSIISCTNNKELAQAKSEIQNLKKVNDSLRSVAEEINSKYVFDSIAIREIPNYQNTYKKNSEVRGEIVISGYNLNNQTNIIFGDSLSFNPLKIHNPDTLKIENGGFAYKTTLDKSRKELKGIIESKTKYGKDYIFTYSTLISTQE